MPALEYAPLVGYDMSGCWQPKMAAHTPLHYDNAHESGEFRHRVPSRALASVADELRRWDALGVPRSKVVLGLGLFGRSWAGMHKDPSVSGYGWCGAPGIGMSFLWFSNYPFKTLSFPIIYYS
jgi:GH18 family chitinase